MCSSLSSSSTSESTLYGLKFQARALAAVCSKEKQLFLAGTCSCKEKNEIHLIRYDVEDGSIKCDAVFSHPPEVWSLSPSPYQSDLFFSTYQQGKEPKATLWKMGEMSSDEDEAKLTEVLSLAGHQGRVKQVIWAKQEEKVDPTIVTLDDSKIRSWKLNQGCSELQENKASSSWSADHSMAACFNPHQTTQFMTANQRNLFLWDLRSNQFALEIENAHEDVIRDLDFNVNKAYYVVSGGDDRHMCFWDLRKTVGPVRTINRHTHWIWNCKFNKVHDQLVLSCGSDSTVNLWSTITVSSANVGELEDPSNEREGDRLVKAFDDHDYSVYNVAWSYTEAWVFASVAYDGRVVVNKVPKSEKYKILL
eukprot:TRINITY_DN2768_c0_g1_i1.p1 TRINITY_DN2768_c0_g1~~TRINITY_DN2768_c0_g1_i1.p1  ORF type:complete len:364 (-),score=87.23 TRINITY_DN2768_c0_g1_i1:413-1504(-)